MKNYVGTYVNRGGEAVDVIRRRNRLTDCDVYAVRKCSLAGRWIAFVRACARYQRTLRLGSRA